jgi:hypothetical protein
MCDAIRSQDFRVRKSHPKRTKRNALIIELSKTLDLNASFMKSFVTSNRNAHIIYEYFVGSLIFLTNFSWTQEDQKESIFS